MEKQSWFKKKSIMSSFALVSFICGFLFLNKGRITGNVIVNKYQAISTLSIVGLLLIFCSIILAIYITKKE